MIMGMLLLTACTTPFHPPVIVHDSAKFVGLAQLLAESPNKEIDVILIHGMCTHNKQWAVDTINTLAKAADKAYFPSSTPQNTASLSDQSIEVIQATAQVSGGTIRFNALVWSGLTAPLKQSLAYDSTGTPTNCTIDGNNCKPERASVNGKLKDTLLNDCLADALIYQGGSKDFIKEAFIDAITEVVKDNEKTGKAQGKTVPLVLVAESLGSKMTFDALNQMINSSKQHEKRAVKALAERLSYIFMAANQLPILSLADRDMRLNVEENNIVAKNNIKRTDSLSQFLDLLPEPLIASPLTVVAFTDPNDLLSYRLLPSLYNRAKIAIANILVSNSNTYFDLLENPYTAHTTYLDNDDVSQAIVCGLPASTYCK